MIEILILAHRGTGKGKRENSLNAFNQGLSYGADGIELDIRLTRDNIPVCVHDKTLKRVYDSDLLVSDLNLSDIKENNLFNDDEITTLEKVFERFGNKIYYDIEIKDPKAIDNLIKNINKYNIDKFMISSFKHFCLKEIREKIPDSMIAPIMDFKDVMNYKKYIIDIVDEYNPFSLNMDVRFFKEENKEKIHFLNSLKKEKGTMFAFWTVNTLEDFKLIENICDFLITDRIPLFKELGCHE